MHRCVFHIPCAVYENGALKSAPWQQVIDEFAEVLYKHTDGFFVQDAVGYYKGRCYAEKLLVAYTDADVADDFVRIARILQQECYAYERDGELVIAK